MCNIPWQKEAKTVKKEGKKKEIVVARTGGAGEQGERGEG
jgi:hypothetical protein